MDEFSNLGVGPETNARSAEAAAAAAFMYFPSSASTPPPPPQSSPHHPPRFYNPNPNPNPNPNSLQAKLETGGGAGSSQNPYGRLNFNTNPNISNTAADNEEEIRAKIVAHPHYSNLLGAYLDCQKLGAPPEMAARLSVIAREVETRQQSALTSGCYRRDATSADPELDQFMEAYCNMLVKYREELTRPLQEAMEFLRRVESQLNSLTNGATASIFSTAEKFEGVGSSEEDQDGSGAEAEQPEIDPRAEDKELKHHLLKKYSGYLSSLRHELSKKKKKGKLPKEARQKLLNWWELHYKWPYPSETEKVALAESTGLDQKQINNWFINQRKRHWKPSEDMQFVVMDAFHPQNAAAAAAALYMGGHFMGDGSYRLGP